MIMRRLRVIYDGQCPFCSAYVELARLREGHEVELVDARERPDMAGSYRLDLDAGMIVDLDGAVYHGADALWIISVLSSRSGLLNRMASCAFSRRRFARVAYPLMRASRTLVLRVLGRRRIGAAEFIGR